MNDEVKWITRNGVHIPITNAYMNDKIRGKQKEPEGFENSKVRDENGNLLKVYHGTQNDFENFDEKYIRERPDGIRGFYFTTENRKEGVAGYYAGNTGAIKEAYVNIEKPLYLRTDEYNDKIGDIVKSGKIKDYDGIITINDADWTREYWNYKTEKLEQEVNKKGDIIEVIPFSKEQIKIISSEKRRK
jgi:hypothetical protein